MKKISLLFAVICILSLCGCSGGKGTDAVSEWDCSVTAAADNTDDAYVITYSNEKIQPRTDVLTVENRNAFPMEIHLLTAGKEEFVQEIQSGGCAILHEITPDASYTVGVHADVSEGTDIAIMVYDGTSAEPYEIS